MSTSTSRKRSLRSGSPSSRVSASQPGVRAEEAELGLLVPAGRRRREVAGEQLVRAEELRGASRTRLDVVAQRPQLHREHAVAVGSRWSKSECQMRCGTRGAVAFGKVTSTLPNCFGRVHPPSPKQLVEDARHAGPQIGSNAVLRLLVFMPTASPAFHVERSSRSMPCRVRELVPQDVLHPGRVVGREGAPDAPRSRPARTPAAAARSAPTRFCVGSRSPRRPICTQKRFGQKVMTWRMTSPAFIWAKASLMSSILIMRVIIPSRSSWPAFQRRSRRWKSLRTSAEP